MKRLLTVSCTTIDLEKVVAVGPIIGDPAWLRYSVYFSNDIVFYFYESGVRDQNTISRNEFIKKWKEYLNEN